MSAKEVLVQAGLGEKKVEVSESSSTKAFHDELIRSFPKLQSAGGVELMRCLPNSRSLEPISYSIAKSPKLLRQVIGNSRIYIRPIQRDLDVSPELEDEVNSESTDV